MASQGNGKVTVLKHIINLVQATRVMGSRRFAAMSVGSWWGSERTSQGQGREGAKLISLVGECAKCQARAIVLVERRDNASRKLKS